MYDLINTFSKVSAAVENYIYPPTAVEMCLNESRGNLLRIILGIYSININCSDSSASSEP